MEGYRRVPVKARSHKADRWLMVAHMLASLFAADCDAWPYI